MNKSLKFQGYLYGDQLPRQVQIFTHTVNLEILDENLHDSITVYGDSFLTDVFNISNENNSSGCILFSCSYAVAMLKHVNGTGNVSYFLFDSHCRNSRGITDGEIGFSILMKFESLLQIERYIEETYQISGRMYPPYFQIQFVSVNLSVDELVIIRSCQVSNFRRIKRQQRQAPKENLNRNQHTQKRKRKKNNTRMAKKRARFQTSPRHEETKNTDGIRKRMKKAFHSKVTVFKELINSEPYYKCVVCNRCLYRRSVATFKRGKFSAFSDKVFSSVLCSAAWHVERN